jgi:hypothetical protein
MAVIFLSAVSLFARDVEITVIDIDLFLPLEGAMIRSWDGKEYICDEDGRAVIQAPDDRQVVIHAAYPGYETGRLVITVTGNSFTASLRLSGIMENRELVIEAERPGSSETRTGRSVAVSGREITQTAEIGIIEDVMSSVKLLPGVGYAGFFNAQPSIRGGDPGDMRASLDGYYVLNPYHWGGGYSIFDPRMVESAQLSHGVFSSRYGHSISGLLEITTKKPSPTETQFELGLNTSAANFNLSIPLAGKGGILFMGRVTYYDPVIAIAKEMGKTIEELSIVNSVRVAPYIRSGTVTGNYRFSDRTELTVTGFFGMDGVGVSYLNSSRTSDLESSSSMDFDWTNYQGFLNSRFLWNPRNDMLLKFTVGTGFEESLLDGDMRFNIYNKSFLKTSANERYYTHIGNLFDNPYDFYTKTFYKQSDSSFNVQGRVDFDWELGSGLIFAAGFQEMFTQNKSTGNQQVSVEKYLSDFDNATQEKLFSDMGVTDPAIKTFLRNYLIVSVPLNYNPDVENKLFTTSGFGLIEYQTPDNRIKTELGIRVDHFYLNGNGFSLQSAPAVNPRLNLDFNIFKDWGIVRSFDVSVGTGLFSSMNSNVFSAEGKYEISELKPNRSWTSILGTRLEFSGGIILNIEGYYKYVFDRMYVPVSAGLEGIDVRPKFNGEGRVWGIDLSLQKLQSRWWDGWLSYSFSWAKYRDPDGGNADMGISGGTRDGWYFPSYHRFHNLNLVINFKPTPRVNIYTRFGLASGVQLSRRTTNEPYSYPVYMYDPDDPANNKFIEVYYWPSTRDENNRTTVSLPMDIKLSIFGSNASGKTRYEVYAAVENVLALLYTAQGNTSFNRYTGQIETGSNAASYEIPIPIPSFGFKISY